MERKPRIAIDPKTFKALKIWSALEGIPIGTLVGRLTFVDMPDNVRDALGETTLKPSPPEAMETICQTVEDAIVCEVKKKTLAYDLAAQETIEELWQQTPRPSYAEIANYVEYPRGTIHSFIRKLIKEGDLAD